ncbi:MAG: hypothetical protein HEQ27_14790 [Dolichospermum sp. JUN01]|nr:hypothetical protein [Dolichospermum sp. JUN01]
MKIIKGARILRLRMRSLINLDFCHDLILAIPRSRYLYSFGTLCERVPSGIRYRISQEKL